MSIVESRTIWGDCNIVSSKPSVINVENAYVIPQNDFFQNDQLWGIYGQDFTLVEEAALLRGPGRILVGQSDRNPNPNSSKFLEGEYIYGGAVNIHYGHFLLEFLPRYWSMFGGDNSKLRILVHVFPNDIEWMTPFIMRIMDLLGLSRNNFINISESVVVENLIVPEPSFVIQSKGFTVFSEFCTALGRELCDGIVDDETDEPIFLSKSRLNLGVWRFENEEILIEELSKAGIRIIHPEHMTIEEQVKLFRRHKVISGIMGSALHTSVFCGTPKKIIALGHNEYINSNFVLVDLLKNNHSVYYHAKDGYTNNGTTSVFNSNFILNEPRSVAKCLVEAILNR